MNLIIVYMTSNALYMCLSHWF